MTSSVINTADYDSLQEAKQLNSKSGSSKSTSTSISSNETDNSLQEARKANQKSQRNKK